MASIASAANTYVLHTVNGSDTNSSMYKWNRDMRDIAYQLKGSTADETVNNTWEYVWYNMEYSFYYKPRDMKNTWTEMKGDCTDGSYMIQKLLRYDMIYSSTVHGWCYNANNSRIKHDWLEYRGRVIDSTNYCYKYVKISSGVW